MSQWLATGLLRRDSWADRDAFRFCCHIRSLAGLGVGSRCSSGIKPAGGVLAGFVGFICGGGGEKVSIKFGLHERDERLSPRRAAAEG